MGAQWLHLDWPPIPAQWEWGKQEGAEYRLRPFSLSRKDIPSSRWQDMTTIMPMWMRPRGSMVGLAIAGTPQPSASAHLSLERSPNSLSSNSSSSLHTPRPEFLRCVYELSVLFDIKTFVCVSPSVPFLLWGWRRGQASFSVLGFPTLWRRWEEKGHLRLCLKLHANGVPGLKGEASGLPCRCDKEERHYLSPHPSSSPGIGTAQVRSWLPFPSRTEQAVRPQGLALVALRRSSWFSWVIPSERTNIFLLLPTLNSSRGRGRPECIWGRGFWHSNTVYTDAFSTNAMSASFSASFQHVIFQVPHPVYWWPRGKPEQMMDRKGGGALEYKACRNSRVGGTCSYWITISGQERESQEAMGL